MTGMSRADERRRTAYHESGQVVAAFMLGRRVEVVSVRPSPTWSGACFFASSRVDAEDLRIDASVIQQHWRLRAQIESRVVVALSGKVAEELAGSRYSG